MFLNVMPVLVVLVPLNVVVIVLGFWWFGKLYSKRFNELVAILTEVTTKQQAELGAFKGLFLKEVMSHDRIFDELVNLDAANDVTEEEIGSNEPERPSSTRT